MEPFWFVLACIVIGMIIYGYISSSISERRRKRNRRERLPDAPPPLIVGNKYNVQLSHGRKIHDITVVGMSEEGVAGHPWDIQGWIVGQRPDGRHVYMQPESVRYVEDA